MNPYPAEGHRTHAKRSAWLLAALLLLFPTGLYFAATGWGGGVPLKEEPAAPLVTDAPSTREPLASPQGLAVQPELLSRAALPSTQPGLILGAETQTQSAVTRAELDSALASLRSEFLSLTSAGVPPAAPMLFVPQTFHDYQVERIYESVERGITHSAGLTAAVTSLGGLTVASQLFATSTAAGTFSITSLGDTHTFTIPSNLGYFTNDAGFLANVSWGQITGSLASQSDLQGALDEKLSTTSAASTYYPLGNPSNYTSATGTVVSVALSAPEGLTVTGSPVTTTGTLSLAWHADYAPVLTASSSNWNAFYDAPSLRIAAGTGLSWAGNTLAASSSQLNYWTLSGSDVYRTSGNVGIGTTTPFSRLTIEDQSGTPQLSLTFDNLVAGLQVDDLGDLLLSAAGGNVRLQDHNLFACALGACPAPSTPLIGSGNVQAENRLIGGTLERSCPSDWVWVPGNGKYGTGPGFCMMQWEARAYDTQTSEVVAFGCDNPTCTAYWAGNAAQTRYVALSTSTGNPWRRIPQEDPVNFDAQRACLALGEGSHLMSDQEWMTAAENVAYQSQNWADTLIGSTVAGSGGLLRGNVNLNDSASCGSNAILDGTTAGTNCIISGGPLDGRNKRMHLLSTGASVWDFSGNVYEWTNARLWNASAGGFASTTFSEMPDAGNWTDNNWREYTAVTNFKALSYAKPPVSTWASSNGIGQMFTSTSTGAWRGFRRGGGWNFGAFAGVFALALDGAPPAASTNIGFRCAR